jgi:RNA polymerase sigma-70 factor (ECF subfamily)
VRQRERLEYEWLFRASYLSVVRTVTLIVRDRSLAEEIAQDAYLQLFLHWRTVEGYERPEAWVRKVAVRLAIRRVKRESDPRRLAAVTTESVGGEIPDLDLARAVAELAPMQRAVVVLYYYEDLSVAEAARLLSVSESTVKQHLMRARSRLADRLGEEADEDVR